MWCWCKDIWRTTCTLHSVLPQFSTILSATRTERWELGVFNLFRFALLWSLHKEQAAFFPKKKRNKCLSQTTCAILLLWVPRWLCVNTHTYYWWGSLGPFTGATLPKARNILYASIQVLIAMQVKRLLELLLSKMCQTTIHNVIQVTLKYHYYKCFLHLCYIPICILFVLNGVQNYNYCVPLPNGCRPLLKRVFQRCSCGSMHTITANIAHNPTHQLELQNQMKRFYLNNKHDGHTRLMVK